MSLNDLSKEELIKMVTDLQEQVDTLTNPPPNDWHSWFYSLLMIELHGFPSVKVEREVVLGAQPPWADFVIVKEEDIVDLGLGVFRDFVTIHGSPHPHSQNPCLRTLQSAYADFFCSCGWGDRFPVS